MSHSEDNCPYCNEYGVVEETCGACNGSGEGMYDGSICWVCHGTGVEKDYCDCGKAEDL